MTKFVKYGVCHQVLNLAHGALISEKLTDLRVLYKDFGGKEHVEKIFRLLLKKKYLKLEKIGIVSRYYTVTEKGLKMVNYLDNIQDVPDYMKL